MTAVKVAVRIAQDGEECCTGQHVDGWFCTRLAHHKGEHMATGAHDDKVIARWRGGRMNG